MTKLVTNATKFLSMRSYLNMHSPFVNGKFTKHQATVVWLSQKLKNYIQIGICDMIKGNESDVGNIDFELHA